MLLTLLPTIPLIIALLVFINPLHGLNKAFAIFNSLCMLGLSAVALYSFRKDTAHFQMEQIFSLDFIFGSSVHLAIDGVSLPFVLLVNITFVLTLIGLWAHFKMNSNLLSVFILSNGLVLGCLLSIDLFVFFVSLEALTFILLALLFAQSILTSRQKMTVIFLQFAGSAMILSVVLCCAILNKVSTGDFSTNFRDIVRLEMVFIEGRILTTQSLLLFLFMAGIFVKSLLFPFHYWKTYLHKQTGVGTFALVNLFLVVSVYSIIRFPIQIFAEASAHYFYVFLFLASVHIIYGALLLWSYKNKAEIFYQAYLVIFGFMVFGIFLLNDIAVIGVISLCIGSCLAAVGLMNVYDFMGKYSLSEFLKAAKTNRILTYTVGLILAAGAFVPISMTGFGIWFIFVGAAKKSILMLLPLGIGVILYMAFMSHLIIKMFLSGNDDKIQGEGVGQWPWNKKLALAVTVVILLSTAIFFEKYISFFEHSIRNMFKPKIEKVVFNEPIILNGGRHMAFNFKDFYGRY